MANIYDDYWKEAAPRIRASVPSEFGGMNTYKERNAFDGRKHSNGVQLSCIARIKKPKRISVGVYFKSSKPEVNEELYERLLKKSEDIRSMLPCKDVSIEQASESGHQPDGGRKQYNVLVSVDMNIQDREKWEECIDFHCTVAKILYEYIFVNKALLY